MRYSCAAPIEQYDNVGLAGYDRIILPAIDLAEMDECAFLAARSTLERGPIQCRSLNSFCREDLKLCGPGFNPPAVHNYSQALMKRCGLLGIENISLGAPKSRTLPMDYPRGKALDELKESLTAICAEAVVFGVDILLEAVCTAECNFINYTDEALQIVKSMQLDNLHLVFDTYHAFMMEEDEQPLLRAMDAIRLIHVAQDIDTTRRCPRAGFREGHQRYFDAFIEHGYTGEIGVEVSYIDMDGELAETLSILKSLCRVPV